jgi:hypothetical protein
LLTEKLLMLQNPLLPLEKLLHPTFELPIEKLLMLQDSRGSGGTVSAA